MLKLILIKLELNSKIMKTWEVLTVKNQVQIVGMLERELQTFWIMCSVKKKKAYLLRNISFTLPEVIFNNYSLKLGLRKLTKIFRNFFFYDKWIQLGKRSLVFQYLVNFVINRLKNIIPLENNVIVNLHQLVLTTLPKIDVKIFFWSIVTSLYLTMKNISTKFLIKTKSSKVDWHNCFSIIKKAIN